MDLLALNEDVLRYVFAHLDGHDALNLSLTCRRVHDLAISRVAAVIVCNSARDLRSLHAYMLSRSPSAYSPAASDRPLRARFMERLTVCEPAVDNDPFRTYIATSSNLDAGYEAQRYLLVDLLAHAPNLQHLGLPVLHPMLDCNLPSERLAEVLRALPRLVSFKGEAVGDTVLALFHSFPGAWKAHLHALELSYHAHRCFGAYHVPGEPTTWGPLLDLLSVDTVPALRTLTLHFFDPPVPLSAFRSWHGRGGAPHSEPRAPTAFTQLRALHLKSVGRAAVDLVQLCPNVEDLYVSIVGPFPGTADQWEVDGRPPAQGARWHRLRRLGLGSITDVMFVRDLVGGADYLRIDESVQVSESCWMSGFEGELALNTATLLSAVGRARPARMYVALEVDGDLVKFWRELAVLAPGLRFLELRLKTLAPVLPAFSGWLDKVPEALSIVTSLVALRILLPRMAEMSPRHRHTKHALVRQLERERARNAAALPQRLVNALPGLRIVGLCESGKSELWGQKVVGEDDDVEDDGGEEELFELYERDPERPYRKLDDFRDMGTVRYSKWWRVKSCQGGSAERSLDEMPRAESTRLEYYMDAGDWESFALMY
ncbi:hypothetical protein OH77DRAFT_1421492 [Trametes cingulata]|nr:hypothetical protein OH77DRAFT_1421492 [Trametes cingulata]